MAFVEDDLWGHVFRGSTERPGLLATSDLFGKTKVDLETFSSLAGVAHAFLWSHAENISQPRFLTSLM